MGRTEPIAVAYAGALSRQVLGERPDEIKPVVSRNIIKNVKSVLFHIQKEEKGLRQHIAQVFASSMVEAIVILRIRL